MQLVLLALFYAVTATAYQSSLSASGNELYWVNSNIPVTIQTNTTDMSAALTRKIITDSMNEWNSSSAAKINASGSSSNEIKFVKNFPYGSAVIGVTELTFNNSGAIQKASILLNDDYLFRSSPGMYFTGQVFLGDVISHEIGHMFGLSHSEVLDSSMFYSSFSGQSTLSSDDRGGIRSKYDSSYGKIQGHVKGGSSIPVLGAHVQAISRNTGEAIGAISDENGFFEIAGLDLNDTYYLYTSPIKNADSLPGYFANVQNKFCPGAYVGSFHSSCGREFDGKPHSLTLSSQNPVIDVGTLSISCKLRSDYSYDLEKLKKNFSPLTIYNYTHDLRPDKAFVGWFRKPTTNAWSIPDIFTIDLTGYNNLSTRRHLKLSLVSYPMGTQLEYEVTIKQNNQITVFEHKTLTESDITDTYKADYAVFLPMSSDPTRNIFEISVKAKRLSYAAQTFPAYLQFSSDQHLPYLLVASLYADGEFGPVPVIDTKVDLSDNEACLDAPFTYPVTKTQTASQTSSGSSSTNNDQTLASAGCGTIEPPRNGPGSSLPLVAMGFLLSLIASAITKSRKKFLS